MDDKYRAVLLRTMKDFMKFCDSAGLTWYLAFGAAIGAERHKGMIPWDDDIDVYMPRKDYEKFLKMSGKVAQIAPGLEGEYDIVSTRTSDSDYPVAFAKFMDMNTTIWEQEKYPVVFGMFVDVFPLDSVGPDLDANRRLKNKYNSTFKRYRRSIRRYRLADWLRMIAGGRFMKAAGVVKDLLWMRPRKNSLREEFNAMDAAMAESAGDMRITLATFSSVQKVCHPKALFDGYTLDDFEDFEVRLPIGDDAILRQIYGDYMQLPPKFERISSHSHFFVDLSRRMTIKEAKAEIRSGKREKYAGR